MTAHRLAGRVVPFTVGLRRTGAGVAHSERRRPGRLPLGRDRMRPVSGRMSKCALGALFSLLTLFSTGATADPPPDGWRIRLDGSSQGLVDKARLTLGASSVTITGFDAYDDPHPPAFPAHSLDLYTEHQQTDSGWADQPALVLRYRADYGSVLGGTDRRLSFVLETDADRPVTLNWAIATDTDLAQHFLTLRDVATGATMDMWAVWSYSFQTTTGVRVFEIDIVGGRSAPPIAYDQTVLTDEDIAVPITLTATDPEGDPLVFEVVAAPAHGAVLGTPPNVTYHPDADYFGADEFRFRASDGQNSSNAAIVTLHVAPVNDAPAAADQAVTTDEDVPVEVTLSATDPEGDALSFEIVGAPAHGTLSGSAPNLTYTPATNYNGEDRFTFRANDGLAASNARHRDGDAEPRARPAGRRLQRARRRAQRGDLGQQRRLDPRGRRRWRRCRATTAAPTLPTERSTTTTAPTGLPRTARPPTSS